MPSSATITALYTFTADTRARASQVNANFNIFRGHNIPIEPLTQTSSDLTYDLGSDEHRWRTAYVGSVDIETSTSTATLLITGDTAVTTGSMLFKIGGTTKAEINTDGIVGSYVKALPNTSLQTSTAYPTIVSQTFTSSGTFTCPSWATGVIAHGCGGGGGGGGGGGQKGGGGGGAALNVTYYIPIVGSDVLSITVGTGGAGGNGGASNGVDGSTGGSSFVSHAAVGNTYYMHGGNPGYAGEQLDTGGTGASWGGMLTGGGNGGYTLTSAKAGPRSHAGAGGVAGSDGSGSYGGGGGGAGSWGAGGAGGNHSTGAAQVGASAPSYGAGGGGGGGGGTNAAGGSGGPGIIIISWARPKGG